MASIIDVKEKGKVNSDDCILLNISGGGVQRLKDQKATLVLEPWIVDEKEHLVNRILESQY